MKVSLHLQAGFEELEQARTMLAFLKTGSLTFEFCKTVLKLSNIYLLVELLNVLGKKNGFKVESTENLGSLSLIMEDSHG